MVLTPRQSEALRGKIKAFIFRKHHCYDISKYGIYKYILNLNIYVIIKLLTKKGFEKNEHP